MDKHGYVHLRCGHLSFSRHFALDAFLIDMCNCRLRKGHASVAEAIFGFSWVIFMCPQREEEVGVGMFEWRDDIHILSVFWFQTVRESKETDEVC